jgi:hypothetical protein
MDGGAKNDNSGGGQDKSLKVANMVGQKMLNQHQAK